MTVPPKLKTSLIHPYIAKKLTAVMMTAKRTIHLYKWLSFLFLIKTKGNVIKINGANKNVKHSVINKNQLSSDSFLVSISFIFESFFVGCEWCDYYF